MKKIGLFITLVLGLNLSMVLLWGLGGQNSSAMAAEHAPYPPAPDMEVFYGTRDGVGASVR